MPELPEVETIRQQLSKHLPLKINKVTRSKVSSSIVHTPLTKLTNKTITKINRHGKWLLFVLDDATTMLSHLGMSGSWIIATEKISNKHNHITLHFTDLTFNYVDPRRFGHLYYGDDAFISKKLEAQGVDVSSPQFTVKHLSQLLSQSPKRIIKDYLLDQKKFAGIGNYIASEVLAHAHIHPQRLVKTLTQQECSKLHRAIKDVINGSLKSNGVTFSGGYVDAHGEKGEGVKNLVVFHQKICGLCQKTKVSKIIIKGRATFFCSSCQAS